MSSIWKKAHKSSYTRPLLASIMSLTCACSHLSYLFSHYVTDMYMLSSFTCTEQREQVRSMSVTWLGNEKKLIRHRPWFGSQSRPVAKVQLIKLLEMSYFKLRCVYFASSAVRFWSWSITRFHEYIGFFTLQFCGY